MSWDTCFGYYKNFSSLLFFLVRNRRQEKKKCETRLLLFFKYNFHFKWRIPIQKKKS